MELWPILNSTVAQVAAFLVGLGVIGRYVIVPVFLGIRATKRRAHELAVEVEKIRAAVATVEHIAQRELTTNGGSSVVDKINTMTTEVGEIRRDQALMAGSWVKYAFEHARDHKELFIWLKDEHGLDRRRDLHPPKDEKDS